MRVLRKYEIPQNLKKKYHGRELAPHHIWILRVCAKFAFGCAASLCLAFLSRHSNAPLKEAAEGLIVGNTPGHPCVSPPQNACVPVSA